MDGVTITRTRAEWETIAARLETGMVYFHTGHQERMAHALAALIQEETLFTEADEVALHLDWESALTVMEASR